jgi:hypothetical protein
MDEVASTLGFLLGPALFAVILVVGLFALGYNWDGFKFGDYLQAVCGGAGLLAVSHGVHRAARASERASATNRRAREDGTTDRDGGPMPS